MSVVQLAFPLLSFILLDLSSWKSETMFHLYLLCTLYFFVPSFFLLLCIVNSKKKKNKEVSLDTYWVILHPHHCQLHHIITANEF